MRPRSLKRPRPVLFDNVRIPMSDAEAPRAQVVWLWLDHPRFGCGRRQYIAQCGRKWVQLTLVATGEGAQISIAEFEQAARFTWQGKKPTSPEKARRRLRANAKVFGEETNRTKDALEALVA
jgi:hypothetical protein